LFTGFVVVYLIAEKSLNRSRSLRASTRKSTGGKIEVAAVTAKVKSVLPKPKPVSVKKK